MSAFSVFLAILSIIFLALFLFSLPDTLWGSGRFHGIAIMFSIIFFIFLNFSITMLAFDNIIGLDSTVKLLTILMYPAIIFVTSPLVDVSPALAVFCAIVIIFIFCAVIVSDATKNREKYDIDNIALDWLWICLFLQMIGAIIYFFIGRKQVKKEELKEITRDAQNQETKRIFKDNQKW